MIAMESCSSTDGTGATVSNVTTLREGLRAGLGLGAAWVVIWVAVLAVLQPEPAEFLNELHRSPTHEESEGAMTFDLRACADCPGFVLLDRGLGSPEQVIPTSLPVVWSWPALRLASRPALGFDVCEVIAVRFFAFLVLQWLVFGVVIRSGCRLVGSWSEGRGRRTRR
jgi:hypothetical protein